MAEAGNVVHEDDRKLFVGALPQEAKDTDIKEYFGTFGDIENINLKMDPMTGRSRGFAFIVFKELAGIEAALAQTAHVVKGKKVTCKKAEARQGKVYVGKLPPGEALSKEDLQAHFEQFGSVVEVPPSYGLPAELLEIYWEHMKGREGSPSLPRASQPPDPTKAFESSSSSCNSSTPRSPQVIVTSNTPPWTARPGMSSSSSRGVGQHFRFPEPVTPVASR